MSSLKSMSGNFAVKYAPAYDQDAICRELIQGI